MFYIFHVLQQLGDIFINPTTHCKRFYKYFVPGNLHAMHHKQRFVYMVTQRHTKLKEDEITEDLPVCDSSQQVKHEEFLC